MKLFFKLLSLLAVTLPLNGFRSSVRKVPVSIKRENETANLQLTARSAVLMESQSGEILYEKDSHVRLYPASMTKMMGMILVLEAIDAGRLTWEDEVSVSETAKSMGGTQIYLAPGETMAVQDLFKAVAINSANDAIVALGEKVSGSLPAFITAMNEKAARLEMSDTHFANATGFDDPDHYTSAADMAKCGRELLTHGEDILRFSRLKESYVRENTTNPFWLVNTNKLLGHYEGLDGLKTGYTNLAGYNLTATALRGGVRLISVVMKEDSIKNRSKDTTTLLDYGFGRLDRVSLYAEMSELATYSFARTLAGPQKLYLKDEAAPIAAKGSGPDDFQAYIELEKTQAPLKALETVGRLVVTNRKTGTKVTYPVIVKDAVMSYSFMDYWLYNIGRLLA